MVGFQVFALVTGRPTERRRSDFPGELFGRTGVLGESACADGPESPTQAMGCPTRPFWTVGAGPSAEPFPRRPEGLEVPAEARKGGHRMWGVP